MPVDNSAATRRPELYFDSVISADAAGTSSTQPTLGPYGRAFAGSPATRIVGQPTTDSNSHKPDLEMQHPGLINKPSSQSTMEGEKDKKREKAAQAKAKADKMDATDDESSSWGRLLLAPPWSRCRN